MMIDRDYKNISEDVYKVDSGKERDPIQEGYPVANGKYRVLKAEDTPTMVCRLGCQRGMGMC